MYLLRDLLQYNTDVVKLKTDLVVTVNWYFFLGLSADMYQPFSLYIYIYKQFKMTKMKHTWFPVTLTFVLTHSGNHACFKLVILNCISLYTHVYWALSNSICYNFPQLYIDIYIFFYFLFLMTSLMFFFFKGMRVRISFYDMPKRFGSNASGI